MHVEHCSHIQDSPSCLWGTPSTRLLCDVPSMDELSHLRHFLLLVEVGPSVVDRWLMRPWMNRHSSVTRAMRSTMWNCIRQCPRASCQEDKSSSPPRHGLNLDSCTSCTRRTTGTP